MRTFYLSCKYVTDIRHNFLVYNNIINNFIKFLEHISISASLYPVSDIGLFHTLSTLTLLSRWHSILTCVSFNVVHPSNYPRAPVVGSNLGRMYPRAPLQQSTSSPFATHLWNMSCLSPFPFSNHLNDVPKLGLRSNPSISLPVA